MGLKRIPIQGGWEMYFFSLFLLSNGKAEKKPRREHLSTYSLILLPVLVNVQISFLGSCQVILECTEYILVRMTLLIPGDLFPLLTVSAWLPLIIMVGDKWFL